MIYKENIKIQPLNPSFWIPKHKARRIRVKLLKFHFNARNVPRFISTTQNNGLSKSKTLKNYSLVT